MTIQLEVDGVQYKNFISANVDKRLDALSSSFSFEATSENGNPLPFVGGELCKIIVNNEVVLTGSIEIVDVTYSAGAHSIGISGRDKTADLLDSTLDSISDLTPPIDLKQIIERVISELGLDINVISEVELVPFNKAEDIISPEPGENAFEFIEQYSKKRQVLLTSNGEGDIVISRASGTFVDSPIRHTVNSNANNVLESNASYDTTGRYNLYKFASSLNPISLNAAGEVNLDDVVSQSGRTIDEAIRPGRQLVLIADNPYSNEQDEERAIWEANVRKARGKVYTVSLHKFDDNNGNLWKVNTIVSIVDAFAGINARMLVNSVIFSFNLSEGSRTSINFVEENSYTLTLNEPKTEEIGLGLIG